MSLDVAGVYDIESAKWDEFVCGSLLGRDGESFTSWDEDEFFDALTSRKGKWYAHAGGRYDALWGLDVAARRGNKWSAKMRGSSVMSARLGQTELCDSYAIVPFSLKKAAPMGGVEKEPMRLKCECGSEPECGGFCALERKLTASERACVEDYVRHDCYATIMMLDALEHRAFDANIDLGLTVGGTAWRTAKDWLGLPKCEHSLGTYRRIREAYYGGRCEAFITRAKRMFRFDRHASYPATLVDLSLPHGECELIEDDARKAGRVYRSGREGVFWADVKIPESHLPPLPVRMPDRLLYPHGKATGCWTAHELRYAEEQGAKIERIRCGYAWTESSPFLAPYAERVWDLRAQGEAEGTPAGKAWAGWCKFLANSLTGKLASKPENQLIRYVPAEDGYAPVLNADTEIVALTRSGAFYAVTKTDVATCAHVELAAYLTSGARTEQHCQLSHAGNDAVYGDTDSSHALRMLTRGVGDHLGEWGYEGAANDWHCLAPKVYKFRDDDGKWHVKGKGMSGLDASGFERLAQGDAWIADRGVRTLKTAIERGDGLFVRKDLSRSLKPVDGWIGGRELNADGITTRATTIASYRERVAA